MKLRLQRTKEIDNTVFGELFVNDKFFCYTLEDKIRDIKIKHETCISPGVYKIILSYSQRFKTILPLLLDVPNFIGIRIHAGNTIKDTSGCILVGSAIKGTTLLHSKTTTQKLISVLTTALKKESVEIEVLNPIKEISPIEDITNIILEVPEVPEIIQIPIIPEVIEEPPKILIKESLPTNSNLLTLLNQLLKWLIKYF